MKINAKSAVAMLTIVFGIILCTTGCGDKGPKRYNVSGTVNYEGKPVPAGTIEFFPDSSAGNSGPAGSAQIVDGKFNTMDSGTGVVGGAHRITVTAFDGNAKPELDLPNGEILFFDYTEKQDLPKEDSTLNLDIPTQKNPLAGNAGER